MGEISVPSPEKKTSDQNFVKNSSLLQIYDTSSINFLTSKDIKNYRKRLLCNINGLSVPGLVDSGNFYYSCISENLLTSLGIKLKELEILPGNPKIATAAEGSSLTILGRLKNSLKLKLGDHSTIIKFKPVVIRDLAMPLNLSGPFLKSLHIDQLHSKGGLLFQGKFVPLLSDSEFNTKVELKESPLYSQNTVIVPPLSQRTVNLVAPYFNSEDQYDVLINGKLKNGLMSWKNVLCKNQGKHLIACVFNPTDSIIHLKQGAYYGDANIANSDSEDDYVSQRICVMETKEHLRGNGSVKSPRTNNDPVKPTLDQIKSVISRFKFDINPVFEGNAKLITQAALLMFKYNHLFSENGEIGKTDLLEFEINLNKDARVPIVCKNRPLNPNLEQEVKRQLEKWLSSGVIEESSSPYNFPLVCVRKKNSELRLCVDFRKLNACTIKDKFPLTNIQNNLSRLHGNTVYSSVDGSGAFNCIPVRKADRDKLAFSAAGKQYRFCRMPFGVTNGPPAYSRLMTRVLQHVPADMALCYLDDVLIYSRDVPSHIYALDKVFEAHEKAGLKLNPDKSKFFQDNIVYLGMKINGHGISPDPEATKIIKNWPLPKTITELKTFLGKLSYFRSFIKDFSKLSLPLTEKLKGEKLPGPEGKTVTVPKKKGDKLDFDSASLQSFNTLRQALCTAPVLAHPDFSGKYQFILDTDFSTSHSTIGGVLLQKQPDGTERPIAYAAKKCSDSQRSYDAFKGEMLALLTMLQHFKYYLLGNERPFLVRVDNRALQHLKSMNPPSAMATRWLEALSNYNFEIQHRSGTKHLDADSLSRIDHADTGDKVITEISEDEKYCIFNLDSQVESLFKTPLSQMNLSLPELSDMQSEDEDLKCVKNVLSDKRPVSNLELMQASCDGKLYLQLLTNLRLIGDFKLLVYDKPENKLGILRHRTVILWPKQLYHLLMKSAHIAVAHRAADATIHQAQKIAFFPNMKRMAEQVVRECRECQTKSGSISAPRHILRPTHTGTCFDKISIDFVGPLARSYSGNEYLLTLKCLFSKWVEAFPVKRANAATVVEILEREIIPRFGLMTEIHSDRATSFLSDLLSDVYLALGIKSSTTPSYNPRSNPVERSHRDLGAAITALSKNDPRNWERVLPAALFASRTSINSSTGFSPFELIFGREPNTPLDLLFQLPQPHTEFRAYEDYATELRNRLQRAFEWARENLSRSVRRQRLLYSGKVRSFLPGAKVWLFTPKFKAGQRRKFRIKWTGPWIVKRKLNDVTYLLTPDPSWMRRGDEVVSIDRIKPFYSEESENDYPPHVNADLGMDGDEFAEDIDDDSDEEAIHSPLPTSPDLPENALPPPTLGERNRILLEQPPPPEVPTSPSPPLDLPNAPLELEWDDHGFETPPLHDSSAKTVSKPPQVPVTFDEAPPEIVDKHVRFDPIQKVHTGARPKVRLTSQPSASSSSSAPTTRSKMTTSAKPPASLPSSAPVTRSKTTNSTKFVSLPSKGGQKLALIPVSSSSKPSVKQTKSSLLRVFRTKTEPSSETSSSSQSSDVKPKVWPSLKKGN